MVDVPGGPDWNPRDPGVLADQIAAYDRMRSKCPVALDHNGQWSVLGHSDVVRVLDDHETFSNRVSVHVAVPNGMDPPEHTGYRRVVNRYYTPERMADFEPVVHKIVSDLLAEIPRGEPFEVKESLGDLLAIRIQNAFMGWPDELTDPLLTWIKTSHAATLAQDRTRISAVAEEFDSHIRAQLDRRRGGGPVDVTAELMHETVDDRLLTEAEITMLIRNWTVGELGTMAASFGIIIEFLAEHPEVLNMLQEDPSLAERTSDEILRIHPPLIANRRRVTKDTTLGGRELAAGDRLQVVWASANRDETVFGDPDEFRLDREDGLNLLYGRGVHVCPGAPLARMEFRVFLEELVRSVTNIQIVPDKNKELAIFPASGFSELWATFD